MASQILLAAAKMGIHLYLNDETLAYKAPKGAITEEFKKTILENKATIISILKSQKNAGLKAAYEIKKIAKSNEIILPSYAQQRLWLLDQVGGGSAHYNMPGALTLTGTLDVQALNQAFTCILDRHESLRTCFAVDENNQPVQVIQTATSFQVPVTDLSHMEEGARQLTLSEVITEEAGRVFDLSCDLMLRAQLVKVAADKHVLLVTMHHIASDGWSMSILINEFSALYTAYVQGQANPLGPLAIQYSDYAHWQRNWLQGEVLDKQLGYWTKQLAGLPVVHSLPLDHARPAMQSFNGETHLSQIDIAASRALNNLCRAQGATLFMGLHAAFSVLLSRYSNETDIVVGSPIANREQAEVATLIGFFLNTLVLRSDLSGNPSFTELLNQSKGMLLDAYAHQQVPFEQIVERLQPERNMSHSALFQVLLVLQNNAEGTLDLPGLTLSPVEQSGAVAKYDLTLSIRETAQGLLLGWEYNTALFEQQSIIRMANHFELLLKALVTTPDASVLSVDMLSAQERQQLLIEWNDTAVDYPNDKCIHELFEAQAENNPETVAVIFENRQLTYSELNQKANQLAHYLINEKDVKPDTLVGICVERSLEMLIGIIAILKAGGAYVPLDPEYPEARLKYMLEDANLTTVLTQRHLRETTPVNDAQAVCLDSSDLQEMLAQHPTTNPVLQQLGLTSSHLAYVIYTSGSTGNPKGVMVEHENVANFLISMRQKPGINTKDTLLAVTSTSFDIHGLELFLPLIVGAQLVVASRAASSDPDVLLSLMAQYQVSLMQATPATWKMLIENNWEQNSQLKILCGGEALGLHLAQSLLALRTVELWNMYGPTETTIWSTTQQVLPDDDRVLMGRPIGNTQVYIVSDALTPVPAGVSGELLIAGLGVSRGYLNRLDLTTEKFIANPFYDKNNPASSERLYKTGDLVRWLPDGNLEFLGRIDHQVKIRGFRVELGEIENTLSSHTDVKDAIVLAKDSVNPGDKRLVAYIVTDAVDTQDENEAAAVSRQNLIDALRHHLGETLPDYMVPSAFVLLSQLPLTPNGKVDRKALPEPDMGALQTVYVAPRTPNEKVIVDIWSEMFGISAQEIGIDSNFFRIGGDSLSAVKFKSLASKEGLRISLKDIIGLQTIRKLAEASHIEGANITKEDVLNVDENLHSENELVLLPEQEWFFSENYENPEHFNIASIIPLDFELDYDTANKALSYTVLMHDALSSGFVKREGKMISTLSRRANTDEVHFFDLSTTHEDDHYVEIEKICAAQQKKFHLEKGPLFCLVYFYLGSDKKPLLFYAFNHLICDGASLDIFFKDFQNIYIALLGDKELPPPKKTYTLAGITKAIENIVFDGNNHRLNYWLAQPFAEYQSYITDYNDGPQVNLVSSARICAGSLSKSETEMLVDFAVKRLGFSLIDILYYALAKALALVNSGSYIPIWHIASGRSFIEINSNIEMEQAVGWFSMPSPRFININKTGETLKNIQEMANTFKQIPDGGCSYLPLYYSNDASAEKVASFPDEDKVVLNHLGIRKGETTSVQIPDITMPENPNNYRSCLFKCVTEIVNGELRVSWHYSEKQYKLETIKKLVAKFLMELREIQKLDFQAKIQLAEI